MKSNMFKIVIIAVTVIINMALMITVIISVKNVINDFKEKQENRITGKPRNRRIQ